MCSVQLALRAGNEKDSDETADTVGCCSIRVEHISEILCIFMYIHVRMCMYKGDGILCVCVCDSNPLCELSL